MKLPCHSDGEEALAREDVGRALTRANEATEVNLGVARGLHSPTDRLDRFRRFDRPTLVFIILDEERELRSNRSAAGRQASARCRNSVQSQRARCRTRLPTETDGAALCGELLRCAFLRHDIISGSIGDGLIAATRRWRPRSSAPTARPSASIEDSDPPRGEPALCHVAPACCATATGIENENVEPCPMLESTRSCPHASR